MVVGFLKGLFSGGPETKREEPVIYKEFQIYPAPRRAAGGWQVAGIIAFAEGETRVEKEFVRADCCSSREDAIQIATQKATHIIDQLGNNERQKLADHPGPL